MLRLSSYVTGRWLEGRGRPAILVNPATEAALAEASSEGLDFGAALDHARDAGGPALRALTFAQRGALLLALSKVLHQNREELLDLAQQNGGNTRGDAKFDVDGAIGTLAAYAGVGDILGKKYGDRRFLTDGDGVQLARSPRFVGQHIWTTRPGVAVHVNAFNFPAWGTFEKVAVAFCAGVPVITKPATATALLTWRMVQLVADHVPAGALQLVCGSTGDLLGRLGPMDHLAFTGSNGTGAALRGTDGYAARGVRVNVEADSLNAAVLGPDVDTGSETWATMVRSIATDMTQKTGQKCTAIRRVLAPVDRMDDVRDALLEALSGVVPGDPTTDGVTMGPVSTAAQLRDGLAGIRTLAGAGTLVLGTGERVDGRNVPAGKGYFIGPTVVRADGDGPWNEIEVFGPCVTLIAYDGEPESAAAIVARGQGSLVATAATDDRAWVERFVAGAAPHLGRLMLVSSKVADQVTPPGMVLPSLVHGGPGRAGGGEELGGERGLLFYMQRTALQGDRVVVGKLFGNEVTG